MSRALTVFAIGAMLTLSTGARAAFVPLPTNATQVNDDVSNSIDPRQDAGVSDVAGGTVVAGRVQVPWATFEQKTGESQQIFVRAFKNGAWVTQGFPASLNLDTNQEAEAPSIDFAGPGRTVPWVAWYEPTVLFGPPTNIFASRFNVGANLWLPSGQDRGAGFPSLNIHTDRTAENPSVAGGATVAGNDPVPWVAWEENDGAATDDAAVRQIFVSKAVKQGASGTPCTGFTPGAGNNLNGFCWQQVGLRRLDPTSLAPSSSGDPTLNIDPTRAGVEPDIAFTGTNDTVAWVVWYEEDPTQLAGLRSNDMVFAAKIVADASADGGFHWVAVGNGTAGAPPNVLDNSGTHHFGNCAENATEEDRCTLNKVAGHDAENPRVAAGTLTPGKPTVPWVVWQEDLGTGKHAVFVSRLVGGDHFELFNSGQPVSNTVNDATRPDITFSGNVPYLSWQEEIAGAQVTFVGHFEGGASAPIFRLDTPAGIAASAFDDDQKALRAPISSGCTANPTNADGAACQGGAVGTPFFLFTAGDPGSQKLFAQAYAPSDVATLAPTDVTTGEATLEGSANPGGAAIRTHFDFGTTSAYGARTAEATLGVASLPTAFAASATGLSPGSTVHFRAVAQSDFVTVPGADRSFVVENTPPEVSIENLPEKVRIKKLGRGRLLSVDIAVSEPSTVTIAIVDNKGHVVRQVVVDRATAGSFTTQLSLKRVKHGRLTLRVTATDGDGASTTVSRLFRAR
jgi:hypothetical protein